MDYDYNPNYKLLEEQLTAGEAAIFIKTLNSQINGDGNSDSSITGDNSHNDTHVTRNRKKERLPRRNKGSQRRTERV